MAETWIIYDWASILATYIISIGLYIALKKELAKPQEATDMSVEWLRGRNIELICSTLALSSFLMTGLLFVISYALYWMTVIWLKRTKRVN